MLRVGFEGLDMAVVWKYWLCRVAASVPLCLSDFSGHLEDIFNMVQTDREIVEIEGGVEKPTTCAAKQLKYLLFIIVLLQAYHVQPLQLVYHGEAFLLTILQLLRTESLQ